MQAIRTVGFLLFDHVEVLDFAGPFEAFSTASRMAQMPKPFGVCTMARKAEITVSPKLRESVPARLAVRITQNRKFASEHSCSVAGESVSSVSPMTAVSRCADHSTLGEPSVRFYS